uniref:Uncharacterized protein n=1 Tax=Aegilops tauschii subsp. strangulata TaxID=200361 RepID=A0A453CMG8_AEGTS
PRLMCVPSLYNDLTKVFQFQKVEEKVPGLVQCDSDEKLTTSDAKDRVSVKQEAGSDTDEPPQFGEGDCVSSTVVSKSNKCKPESGTCASVFN